MVSLSRGMAIAILAMVGVVALANYTVQFPINAWLTWGAIIYPATFFVTDLANRAFGASGARRVVYVGFVFGLLLSCAVAPGRIALASGETSTKLRRLLTLAVPVLLVSGPWVVFALLYYGSATPATLAAKSAGGSGVAVFLTLLVRQGAALAASRGIELLVIVALAPLLVGRLLVRRAEHAGFRPKGRHERSLRGGGRQDREREGPIRRGQAIRPAHGRSA